MAAEDITIELEPTPRFIPPLVEGDMEFAGHGPDVTVFTELQVRNENQLWAHVWMRARETRDDWTTSEGGTDIMVFNGSLHTPPITHIYDIISDRTTEDTYRDVDHDEDVRSQSEAELVREYRVTGDTKGDEAGTRTGVSVRFNPVTIRAETEEAEVLAEG